MRKTKVFIAMSLDGYIADKSGGLDWLKCVEVAGEDYGYQAFIVDVDTLVMGRKTYEKIISFGIDFPYQDKKCYVISSAKNEDSSFVDFISGDVIKLVSDLKQKSGKNIYVDGGQLICSLLAANLIDEMIISVIPVLLGNGIGLFEHLKNQIELELISSKSFESGLVQMHYGIKKNDK
jgi:dihydrofolate reductase